MRAPALAVVFVLAGCASSSTPAPSRGAERATAPASSAGVAVTTATTAQAGSGRDPGADRAPTQTKAEATTTVTTAGTEAAPVTVKGPAILPRGAMAPSEADLAADVRAANGVALAIYKRLSGAPGNQLVSGTSLRHALGATYLGARGTTARELAKALGYGAQDAVAGLGAAEEGDWKNATPPDGSLAIATRLWVDEGFPLATTFLDRSAAYGAPAETLALAHEPDAARAAINAWVSERTHGRIPELLARGTVDARARMIVTNALHLKARWSEPFPRAATKDEPFRLDAKRNVPVPTMHVTASMRHATVGTTKLVELRYDGTPLAMMVVVPGEPGGLASVERALSPETLETWTRALVRQRVALAMPRFSFSAGGAMNDALRDLGVRVAFSEQADFGAMLEEGAKKRPDGRLALSQVVQRTFVAVDETGTEAAAATGVVMRTTSLETGTPVEVKVDRPFLFVIRDVTRGRVLFVGRTTDPRSAP